MNPPSASSHTPDTACFVLAGGQSSRMGSEKALAIFAGIPLIQKARNTLAAASPNSASAPRIAGSRTNLSAYANSIPDTWPEVGPLGGVHAALSITAADWNLFLPVDMPLIPASLLRLLIERAQITGAPVNAFQLAGRLEPFPVLLHRSVLPYLNARLQNGQTAGHLAWKTIPTELNASLDAPAVENLIQAGQISSNRPEGPPLPPVFWFKSANTPAELALLNRLYKLHGESPCLPVS